MYSSYFMMRDAKKHSDPDQKSAHTSNYHAAITLFKKAIELRPADLKNERDVKSVYYPIPRK